MMYTTEKKLSQLVSSELEHITIFLNNHWSTVFHEPEFNEIASEVFGTTFRYLLVHDDGGRLVALCPLHTLKHGTVTMVHSGLAMHDVPYGGWVYDSEMVSLKQLMHYLKLSANEALTYWSVPQVGTDEYSSLSNKKTYETAFIDLSLTLDDILQTCVHRKRRQGINRAIRKGVVVELLEPSRLNIFTEQSKYLKESLGLHGSPVALFERLYGCFYRSGKIMAFAAKFGGQYIASGILIRNRFYAHLWVAGKGKDIPKDAPRQELLIWQSIQWAKDHGSRYYDLCVVESERLPQIAQFKLGFSHNVVPFYLYSKKTLGYRLLARMRKTIGRK